MKLGPPAAMAAVLGISLWVFLGTGGGAPTTPGAHQFEVILNKEKVKVEQLTPGIPAPSPTPSAAPATTQSTPDDPTTYRYRFLNFEPIPATRILSTQEFNESITTYAGENRNVLLKLFNVSSYRNLLWAGLGLLGQLLFAGRMWVQWLTSEKERRSVVPPAFWFMSLGGGLLLTTYFIWRHDLVGVLGQASGLVIYARNIRLLYKHKPVPNSSETNA